MYEAMYAAMFTTIVPCLDAIVSAFPAKRGRSSWVGPNPITLRHLCQEVLERRQDWNQRA